MVHFYTVYIVSRRIYIHRTSITITLFILFSSHWDDLRQILLVVYTCTSLLAIISFHTFDRSISQRHSTENYLLISFQMSLISRMLSQSLFVGCYIFSCISIIDNEAPRISFELVLEMGVPHTYTNILLVLLIPITVFVNKLVYLLSTIEQIHRQYRVN